MILIERTDRTAVHLSFDFEGAKDLYRVVVNIGLTVRVEFDRSVVKTKRYPRLVPRTLKVCLTEEDGDELTESGDDVLLSLSPNNGQHLRDELERALDKRSVYPEFCHFRAGIRPQPSYLYLIQLQ